MSNIAFTVSLKPVTFHYKSDPKNTPSFGLIAEEVVKVDPALVVRDKEGKPYTVRYDQVNAMLLNEFLKEHRVVQERGQPVRTLASTDTNVVSPQYLEINVMKKRIDCFHGTC